VVFGLGRGGGVLLCVEELQSNYEDEGSGCCVRCTQIIGSLTFGLYV